jgi:hypothetical protein
MLTRILLVMTLSASPTLAKTADDAAATDPAEKLSVDVVGVGSKTCGYWLSSPSHRVEGAVWIYGFWSGLNYVAAASEQQQFKAGSADILDAVEKACRRLPSQILASAVWSVYVGHKANDVVP